MPNAAVLRYGLNTIMPDEITSNATDVKAVVEKSSITEGQFAAQRVAALQARLNPKKEDAAKEPDDGAKSKDKAEESKVEAQQSDAKESKDEAKDKDVLSQVNLDELSDSDIAELATKGKSGLLKRVAELTAKRKLAEEKLAQREQELAHIMGQKNPAVDSEIELPKEISSLSKPEEIQAKFKQAEEVIDWAEAVLDSAEGMMPGDVVATIDGKDYTKAQVKEYMRDARKVKDKYLPAQARELQSRIQRETLRSTLEQQARKELDWFDGEDNEVRKNYQAMLNDPRLAKLEKAAPELAPQLPYILAHAANSMFGRKSIPLEAPAQTKTSPKITPPASPNSSAAQSDRAEDKTERNVKEISKRLMESGRPDDFIALRTAQLSKRKRL